MILKIKLSESTKTDIYKMKTYFFDSKDNITMGYIIGLAVDQTSDILDEEWKNGINYFLCKKEKSKTISTSISLRKEVFEKIKSISEKLQLLSGKTLYMSKVIDIIIYVILNRLNKKPTISDSLSIIEWNLNARTGFPNYVIPTNLISNVLLRGTPDVFVFTEFVQTTGWFDLKLLLENKYDIWVSPYVCGKNGICIGIRKDRGIVFVETKNEDYVFNNSSNAPDFFEVKVKFLSDIISIIGTRIRIGNANGNKGIQEQRQRFEQYQNLVDYISKKKNEKIILVGDFNNSRILGNESESKIENIDKIYDGKDSKEYNFQKMSYYIKEKGVEELLLHTPSGLLSSIGATWNPKKNEAIQPEGDEHFIHKYDHLITNFSLNNIECLGYRWDFLKFYNSEVFSPQNNKIKPGFPDHAILFAKINLRNNQTE